MAARDGDRLILLLCGGNQISCLRASPPSAIMSTATGRFRHRLGSAGCGFGSPPQVAISFDVSTVVSGGADSVEVRYRLPLDESVLTRLPATECSISLSNAAAA